MAVRMCRICVAHLAIVREDEHGHMNCAAGCYDLRTFHVVAVGRGWTRLAIVATVSECHHRGRRGAEPCPHCGLAPSGRRKPRNHFERELLDADSSLVSWAGEDREARRRAV